jgi:hypothetical protein
VRRLILPLLALAVCAAPAVAVSGDAAAQRRDLVHNRARWAHQNLRDYRFRLRVSCFCASSQRAAITVTVRRGRPVGATPFTGVRTIPEMFATIRRVLLDPHAGAVFLRYDARRGFPRTVSLDPIKNAVDDEIGWTMDRFQPLPAR